MDVVLILVAIGLLGFPFSLYRQWRGTIRVVPILRSCKLLAGLVAVWALLSIIHGWAGTTSYDGWLLSAGLFVSIALTVAVPVVVGDLLGHILAWVIATFIKTRD